MSVTEIRKSKIAKWDEVMGAKEEDVPMSTSAELMESNETTGASPSISRNYMRGIEDMVEQNDNNFDGVINNVATQDQIGINESDEYAKKSLLEKLKEQSTTQTLNVKSTPRKKSLSVCQELERQ